MLLSAFMTEFSWGSICIPTHLTYLNDGKISLFYSIVGNFFSKVMFYICLCVLLCLRTDAQALILMSRVVDVVGVYHCDI